MTHKERLAEIEKRYDSFILNKDVKMQTDIDYLLTRVRVLTEALEKIKDKHKMSSKPVVNDPTVCSKDCSGCIASKALEGES